MKTFEVYLEEGTSNEVEVTDYVTSYEINETTDDIVGDAKVECMLTVFNKDLEEGQDISIYEPDKASGDRKFYGVIDNLKRSIVVELLCKDMGDTLRRTQVNEVWNNRDVSYIVKDIIDNWTDLDSSGVVTDSDLDVQLDKFVANEDRAFDIMRDLGKILQWQWYVDNNVFYFEPKGYTETDTVLEVGENATMVGEWTKDTNDIINDLKVKGDNREVHSEELFNGDGSTKEFELKRTPVTMGQVTVNGTEMEGGIEGATKNPDYYVNPQNKTVRFTSAPSSGTDNVDINYFYGQVLAVHVKDDNSQDKYGVYEETLHLPRLKTLNEVEEYAGQYLNRNSSPRYTGKLRASGVNLVPGQKIRVKDSVAGVDDMFTVQETKRRMMGVEVEVVVGQPQYNYYVDRREKVRKRIEELEKKLEAETDTVLNIRSYSEDFDVSLSQKQFKLEKREGARSSFILGNPDAQSELGSAVLGDDDRTTWDIQVNET